MLYFYPWIGANYHAAKDKLLILGESHYGDSRARFRGFTQYVITNHAISPWGQIPFFDRTRKLVSSASLKFPEGLDEFWQTVCFANYIQKLLPEPRAPIPNDYWSDAEASFQEMLELVEPTRMLVLGSRLWKHLPNTGGEIRYCADYVDHGWLYDLSDGRTIFSNYIHHPASFGFSISKWGAKVRNFMKFEQHKQI